MRLTDDQWKQVDENTWHLEIKDLYEVDRFQLLGPGDVKMHLNLESTYTRVPGKPTIITPQTTDPLSPFNWAGLVWEGSATSSFSATYDDGTWSVAGTMDYAHSGEGTTGHIMHEKNGAFLRHPAGPGH